MRDAGSRGTVGPNLDDAFQRAEAGGFKESTIENVVLDQIRFPTTGSGMPANLVEGEDAEDVAAYVARCAAEDPDEKALPRDRRRHRRQGLYAALGCQGCHSLDGSPSSGPTFKGLFGSSVKLTNGQTVNADDAYLLESIIDPDKEIVKGYQPGVMSSVIKKGQVSEARPSSSSTSSSSRNSRAARRVRRHRLLEPALGLEVDDDVRDRDGEALAGRLDDPLLEPVRAALADGWR